PYHDVSSAVMAEAVQQQRKTGHRPTQGGARFAHFVVALLPVAACFLGGATQKWAAGVVLVVLGLRMIFYPPRFSLGPIANSLLLGFVAVVGTAFLPARW